MATKKPQGRPVTTGIFATRKEFEREVIRRRKKTMLTLDEIADECGVSIFAIWKVLRDKGLTRKRNRPTAKRTPRPVGETA